MAIRSARHVGRSEERAQERVVVPILGRLHVLNPRFSSALPGAETSYLVSKPAAEILMSGVAGEEREDVSVLDIVRSERIFQVG